MGGGENNDTNAVKIMVRSRSTIFRLRNVLQITPFLVFLLHTIFAVFGPYVFFGTYCHRSLRAIRFSLWRYSHLTVFRGKPCPRSTRSVRFFAPFRLCSFGFGIVPFFAGCESPCFSRDTVFVALESFDFARRTVFVVSEPYCFLQSTAHAVHGGQEENPRKVGAKKTLEK